MKNQFYLGLLLAGLAFSTACKKDKDPDPTPAANTVNITATLNNKQQVPFNNSTATGTFTGSFNKDTRVLTYTVAYTGITPTGGHIHRGRPGQNGSSHAADFASVATSPITGSATLTAADADSLLAGKMYVNLHSAAFPGGEIRGNLNMPTGTVLLKATINGLQQVPANSSTATGTFSGAYNPATKQLNYTVTYAGLAPTLGHIHRGAPMATGTAAVPFASVSTSPISGIATLTTADEALLLNSGMYVNLHTAAFPAGEIRGDITNVSSVNVSAMLDGKQQVPFNASTATGMMTGSYNMDTRVLTYTVTFAGLTPTAGHIHRGRPGLNGSVAATFASVAASPITGTTTLTAADADSLLAGKMYVNLHTTGFPDGEIRGNINMPTGTVLLKATINSAQQIPINGSTATGTFTGAYNPATRQLNYTVAYTGLTPTGAHMHRTSDGTIAVGFNSITPSPFSGIATLTATDGTLLLNNGMYVNLHTAAFPGGEIRGNIAPQ